MSKGASKIKSLYKRTTLREKLLTLAFILVILFLWMNNWLGRMSEWNDLRKFNASELDSQQMTLARGPEFDEGLRQALKRVEPDKTYKASELSGRIDSLLRSAGLSGQADIDPVRSTTGESLDYHNLRVSLKRISITQLIDFNTLLKKDTPYIKIESVRVAANRRNPEELDVRFEVKSFNQKEERL